MKGNFPPPHVSGEIEIAFALLVVGRLIFRNYCFGFVNTENP